jgi:hypothetical protein
MACSEVGMERFVHNENIALYRRLISESERDQSRDEGRHKMLLILLAEEEAKEGDRQAAQHAAASKHAAARKAH